MRSWIQITVGNIGLTVNTRLKSSNNIFDRPPRQQFVI
jgi:hypothetical protein